MTTPAPTWGPWCPNLPDAERAARCRCLAALLRVWCGPAADQAVAALRAAETDPAHLPAAAEAITRLPTRPFRQALASFAALHSPTRRTAA